ncbi:MAG: hypothetical protein PHG87_04005 [Candidatus Omnitrophica bacterium]|nr:hypothetical protein [Candidatus Omnitrophota bacterium]
MRINRDSDHFSHSFRHSRVSGNLIPAFADMTILKKWSLSLFILFFIPACAWAEVSTSLWQTKKSQHFIIYYQESADDFVNELDVSAENYYNSIVEELGFRRMDFWSWDDRAKIYLFNNSADYLNETGGLAWSGAQVSVKLRTIKTFIGQETFFDSILPHELTHIIFREFIGTKTELPLWLDEGIACSQEKSSLISRMDSARALVKQDTYLKFDKLFQIYNSTLIVPNVFYSESASIIVFLLKKYDRELFLDFSRKLRDGMQWKNALLNTYHFSNFEEMESAWKDFMLNK